MDLNDWNNYTPKDIPVQRNGYDCGVFMLRFAERTSRDASFTFSQESMPAVRKLMVHEIINKKALG
jgi:sentrin-specific protease 1